jgi:hypothetical protein
MWLPRSQNAGIKSHVYEDIGKHDKTKCGFQEDHKMTCTPRYKTHTLNITSFQWKNNT